ncbi:MAG TPA: alpha/beta fold hydrolase [Nevskiaceae bacterium]|nr:alpha/beta fold hydrolase [Nevskiaceae bacterium]
MHAVLRRTLCGLAVGCALVAGSATAGPVLESRDGTSYRHEIAVGATGDTVVIQVFEPTRLQVGRTYPLVLHSHGYGGSRMVTPSALAQKLRDAGYYVLSIDERGFGESSGTVRIMSPDFEGQDLVAVLDWAEDLEGLRRRADGKMMVGSYGGSYGGMYQFLLAGADPSQRLRVIAPDITPNDLNYALNSNGVVKSGWGLALSAGAEGLGIGPFISLLGGNIPGVPALPPLKLRQDPAIYETLVLATATNRIRPAGQAFLGYHSVSYFCRGDAPAAQNFLFATPDPLAVSPRPFPKMDALITQGFRDTLFNFNDGLRNYHCLQALGGDVRLLTHQSGHILPLSIKTIPGDLEEALDPFYDALTVPGFQDPGGSRTCGSVNLEDATFAWFEAKLRGKTAALKELLPNRNFCLSLAEGDAIETRAVKRGGTSFEIDRSIPQFSSALGVAGAVLGNGAREALLATQKLYTVPAGGQILAGVPTLRIDIQKVLPVPITDRCTLVSEEKCTPIWFLGIGHRKAGKRRWDLVDDQLTPIRGFGEHRLQMTGVAERLGEGDELALLVYGFHMQYPVTWSRYVAAPAGTFVGTVNLPLLDASDIVREGM